jgi:thioredoxin-dependent peroxiredoxin
MNSFKHIILFLICLLLGFSSSFNQEINTNEVEPQIGDPAPSFQANDDQGNLWKYPEHVSAKYLVIYFYPAAMTGG